MMNRRLAIALNMLSPYWYDVFESLSIKGWDILILVATDKERNREYECIDFSNFSFRVRKTRNLYIDLTPLNIKTEHLHLQYGLWSELKRFRPDVILSNQLGFRTLISVVYGEKYSIPVIPWIQASLHTEKNNSYLRENFRRWLVKRVPCICTNLTEGKKYIEKILRFPSEKIYPAPYSIDVSKYFMKVKEAKRFAKELKSNLGLKGLVFLYVGQFIKRKGLDKLIFALVKMEKKYVDKISFLFVGGKLSPYLRDKLESNGICFSDIGFIQPQELHKYYAISDVFIFPTLEDEWGIVLNEACASGLPIISSIYAGATVDLLESGKNGIKFNPFSENEIVTAIIDFINLPQEIKEAWSNHSLAMAKRMDTNFTVENLNSALLFALGTKNRKSL